MEFYIALLRGVNVGGKNPVPMAQLKTALEERGFSHVSTYINSGNILFASPRQDVIQLQNCCRQVILDRFGLDIAVAILSAEDYQRAFSQTPSWWNQDPQPKHMAIFVIAPEQADRLAQQVGLRPEYEQLSYSGSVIFWSAPKATFSKTKWSKVAMSTKYGYITVRNANSANKLLLLSRQLQE